MHSQSNSLKKGNTAFQSRNNLTSHPELHKLNLITKSINDNLDFIQKSKSKHLSLRPTISKLHDPESIPRNVLKVNKDTALSLNVKPGEKSFVFWFILSSYFPLAALCLGPLANMISIAALVDKWRMDEAGNYVSDPKWVIAINSLSIVFGTISDISLIMNFSRNLNYIVAQIVSIIGWLIASVLLVAIIVAEKVYIIDRIGEDNQQYKASEGYYFAILTALLYFSNSFLLSCNFVGHLKGKYSSEFNLDLPQRGLIFYVLTFAVWLSIGAAIFTRLIGINYGNSLYFCVVSVTTVGLGDITPKSAGAKAFVLVYALVGLLILGLIVSTVRQMVFGRNEPMVFWNQVEKRRAKLYKKYEKVIERKYSKRIQEENEEESEENDGSKGNTEAEPPSQTSSSQPEGPVIEKIKSRRRLRQKIRHPDANISSEDMFKMMELVRRSSHNYVRFLSLAAVTFTFIIFWLLGALAYHLLEGWTFFDSVYFCFLCLLTIGYGVPSPTSTFARSFFVVWALGAIPLNTILISNIGDTIFIICVDYSNKLTEFVFTGRYSEIISSLTGQKNEGVKPLGQLESDLESSEIKEEENEAELEKNDSKTEIFDQLASTSKEIQKLLDQEMDKSQSNPEPTKSFDILRTILQTQRDILELIDVLESIKALLTQDPSPKHRKGKSVHSYEDWMRLSKMVESTIRDKLPSARDAIFWISEHSPLKYPLDEQNYFIHRYNRVLDRKINQLLEDHVNHYNRYLAKVENAKLQNDPQGKNEAKNGREVSGENEDDRTEIIE